MRRERLIKRIYLLFKEKINAFKVSREMERTRTKGQHCCVRVKFQHGVCLHSLECDCNPLCYGEKLEECSVN